MASGAVIVSATLSCNRIPVEQGQGTLSWIFSDLANTRAMQEIPDTDSFVLNVKNSAGEILYEGTYGDSPESMLVNPGSYTVKVVSRAFDKPEFSAPQYGDEQIVVVASGQETKVRLQCLQLNSGLRLKVDEDFPAVYPDGYLMASSEDGSLRYSPSEQRIGFFKSGLVSVKLCYGSTVLPVLSRYLEACEILTIGLSTPNPGSNPGQPESSMSIVLDTTRNWTSESLEIGSGQGAGPGASMATAYGVIQAKEHAGEKSVWVCGYIVGGDLSSTKNGISFQPPFNSMTNFAIAARSSVTEKNSCMAVQLTKGDIRLALNLADHPEFVGKKIYLRGDIVPAYYGLPGIQNLTEYAMK